MNIYRHLLLAAYLSVSPQVAHAADWKPVEVEQIYPVTGKTGAALYASIGGSGPEAGGGRAIAHTNFKLTWTRDYQPRGDACVLASARPKLVITTVLPKPAGPLPPVVRKSWDIFIAGVRDHERVHAQFIVDMVREIEAFSVGLTVPDDRACKKIRAQLTERLSQISQAQRQRNRDFDRVELSEGGAVHQLILRLVNGP